MTNKKAIKVFSPGTENYKKMYDMANGRTVARFDWEGFAKEYNEAEIGSVLLLSVANPKLSNIYTVIENRGLERSVDYSAALHLDSVSKGQVTSSRRVVLVTKRSDKDVKFLREL